ncbi:MAG: hypothetical protein JWP13_972 [Candidatus Saccharibacteria bacterium]|nr:hypothetical protein [Candidatus Saccharibacteria bacterium]
MDNIAIMTNPNFLPSNKIPRFMRARDAASLLDIPVPSMQKLRPETHRLHHPSGTFNYSTLYLSFLKYEIADVSPRKRMEHATSFAQSIIARLAIEQTEELLDAQITRASCDGMLTAAETSRILDVGKASLTDWQQYPEAGIRHDDRSLLIPASTLRAMWERPCSFPGDMAVPEA